MRKRYVDEYIFCYTCVSLKTDKIKKKETPKKPIMSDSRTTVQSESVLTTLTENTSSYASFTGSDASMQTDSETASESDGDVLFVNRLKN